MRIGIAFSSTQFLSFHLCFLVNGELSCPRIHGIRSLLHLYLCNSWNLAASLVPSRSSIPCCWYDWVFFFFRNETGTSNTWTGSSIYHHFFFFLVQLQVHPQLPCYDFATTVSFFFFLGTRLEFFLLSYKDFIENRPYS